VDNDEFLVLDDIRILQLNWLNEPESILGKKTLRCGYLEFERF
jgi:hypothetical protein